MIVHDRATQEHLVRFTPRRLTMAGVHNILLVWVPLIVLLSKTGAFDDPFEGLFWWAWLYCGASWQLTHVAAVVPMARAYHRFTGQTMLDDRLMYHRFYAFDIAAWSSCPCYVASMAIMWTIVGFGSALRRPEVLAGFLAAEMAASALVAAIAAPIVFRRVLRTYEAGSGERGHEVVES
jgi:hypothetical protein